MIRHWLILAWRTLKSDPVFGFISILSLSVGCAGALLVGAYVHEELTFDHWAPAGERIVRLDTTMHYPGRDPQALSLAPSGVGVLLAEELPGVEAVVRIRPNQLQVKTDDGSVSAFAAFTDPAFFDMFPLELIEGDPSTAFADPTSVVISEATRDQLFGEGPVLGRTIEFENADVGGVVTGVMARPEFQGRSVNYPMVVLHDAPFAPEPPQQQQQPPFDEMFNGPNAMIYLRADTTARARAWRESLPPLAEDIVARNAELPEGASIDFEVMPFRSIHLAPQKAGFNNGALGNPQRLTLFALIAAALLVVSAFNYVSLSLARVVRRTREVGLRKAMGATQGDLVRQHLMESTLLSATALLIGFGVAALVLPWFARELQLPTLLLKDLVSPGFIGLAAAGGVILAVLVAAYPAAFLASVRPASILQGRGGSTRTLSAAIFVLVAIQFIAATALGVSVGVFHAQARYLADGDLGFETKDRFMVFAGGISISPFVPPDVAERNLSVTSRLEAELAGEPSVISLGASNLPALLGIGPDAFSGIMMQVSLPDQPTEEAGRAMPSLVNFNYFGTMGIEAVAGRLFSEDLGTDRVLLDNPTAQPDELPAVVTRAFLPIIGARTPEEAIGRRASYKFPGAGPDTPATDFEIVGVVDDVHIASLKYEASPVMFFPNPGGGGIRIAHFDGERREEAEEAIRAAMNVVFPGENAQVIDMEQMAANQYAEERRWRRLITIFAALAIVVACLGLYGLSAFTAGQRRQEVGVRKSLGADNNDIIALMLARFVRPVIVGMLLGWGIAYYAMARWLAGFAVHIPLTPIPFAAAGAAALVVALATTVFHALRSARTSPAKVLRQE